MEEMKFDLLAEGGEEMMANLIGAFCKKNGINIQVKIAQGTINDNRITLHVEVDAEGSIGDFNTLLD